MKRITILCGLLFCATLAFPQQESMLSRYMFNGLYLNPAYAGSHPYFRANLIHRNQWVGFDGAPKTSLLSVDGPISKENMGLGLIFGHETIGATRQNDFYGNYSYFLKLPKGRLSLGLRGGVSFYSMNTNDLVIWDPDDLLFMPDNGRSVIPNFGFGSFYHTDRFFAGFSIPTLMAYQPGNSFSPDMHQSTFLERHYLLTSGYVFDAGSSFKLKPSFLVKYLPQAPVQVDLNMNVMYKDAVTAGVSYRTGDAIIGMMEYQINRAFRIGYAFDYTLSPLRNYSSGTHEVMLGYQFGLNDSSKEKIKNPRFF